MATVGEASVRMSLGLRAAWLTGALVLVLLGLNAIAGVATAEDTLPGSVSVSKAEYIRICEATGGNAIEQSDGSVTCFFPDGSWSRCEFETNTCQDSPSIGRPPGTIIVSPTGIVAEPTEPNGPASVSGIDSSPAGSHIATTVDNEQNRHNNKDKKKDSSRKKRGHGGKGR